MAKQERAVRTREALVSSAAEIFHREGFTIASLTSISRQAGVSNGALHFHFASKAALATAVEEAAMARLRELVASPEPPAGTLQHLVDVTYGLARALSEDVVLRAGFELSSDPARAASTDLRRHWQQWIERTLERAGERGELRPGVGSQGAATAVAAGTVGMEVLSARNADWLRPQTISRFWRLLLPTLAAPELLGGLDADGSGSAGPEGDDRGSAGPEADDEGAPV